MTTLRNAAQIVDVTHLVRPPSELEQARAHLRASQAALQHARDVSVFIDGVWYPGDMKAGAARAVLAALSWVWDAQEREDHRTLMQRVSDFMALLRPEKAREWISFGSVPSHEISVLREIQVGDVVFLIAEPPPPPAGSVLMDWSRYIGRSGVVKEARGEENLYRVLMDSSGIEFWASIEMLMLKVDDAALLTGAEARRPLNCQPVSPRRPTRRAAAPASRGRRRRS